MTPMQNNDIQTRITNNLQSIIADMSCRIATLAALCEAKDEKIQNLETQLQELKNTSSKEKAH